MRLPWETDRHHTQLSQEHSAECIEHMTNVLLEPQQLQQVVQECGLGKHEHQQPVVQWWTSAHCDARHLQLPYLPPEWLYTDWGCVPEDKERASDNFDNW